MSEKYDGRMTQEDRESLATWQLINSVENSLQIDLFSESEVPQWHELEEEEKDYMRLSSLFIKRFYPDLTVVDAFDVEKAAKKMIEDFKDFKKSEFNDGSCVEEVFPDFSFEDIYLCSRISRRYYNKELEQTELGTSDYERATQEFLYFSSLSKISARAITIESELQNE